MTAVKIAVSGEGLARVAKVVAPVAIAVGGAKLLGKAVDQLAPKPTGIAFDRDSDLFRKLSWFDVNGDLIITPAETISRLEQMGADRLSATVGGTVAAAGLGTLGRKHYWPTTDIAAAVSQLGRDPKTTLGLFAKMTRNGDPAAARELVAKWGGRKGYLNQDDAMHAVFDDPAHADGAAREKFRAGIQMNTLLSLAGQIMPDGKVGLTADRITEFCTDGNFFAKLANRRMALLEGRLEPGSTQPASDDIGYAKPGPAARAVASDRYLMEVKNLIPGVEAPTLRAMPNKPAQHIVKPIFDGLSEIAERSVRKGPAGGGGPPYP